MDCLCIYFSTVKSYELAHWLRKCFFGLVLLEKVEGCRTASLRGRNDVVPAKQCMMALLILMLLATVVNRASFLFTMPLIGTVRISEEGGR